MAPDLGELPRHAACPACGAALRPGSPWCTLCYADLRPPEQRPVQPAPEAPAAPPAPPAGDPLTQPLIDFLPSSVLPQAASAPTPAAVPPPAEPAADPTWPCSSCGAINPLAATHCAVCGAAFLAGVAAESRAALVLPVVGDLTKMSRAQRLLGAVTVVVILVLFVAMLTLLLAKRPPQPSSTVEVPTSEPTVTVVQPTTPPPGAVVPTAPPGVTPTTAPATGATTTP